MKNILIFDIEITGHHSEYIGHLVKYIAKNRLSNKYIFIVHYNFHKNFPGIIAMAKTSDNINFVHVSQNEFIKVMSGKLFQRSFGFYNLMKHYAVRHSVKQVILLSFNIFQFALIFKRPKLLIRGILFRPFLKMDNNSTISQLKHTRKILQTRLFLLNKSISIIYILNDIYTANFLNKRFKVDNFKMLPDPVPDIVADPKFSIFKVHNIEPKRKVFLHFGSLSIRKGTNEILYALEKLDNKTMSKIAILFIGKADAAINDLINLKMNLIHSQKPLTKIVYRNEFIPDNQMKSYFEQVDFVLLPNKFVEASSGVLGHALASGKPVIAVNKGLLGNLVSKYKGGYLIKDGSAREIANAISSCIKERQTYKVNNKYIEEHSVNNFAKVILENI